MGKQVTLIMLVATLCSGCSPDIADSAADAQALSPGAASIAKANASDDFTMQIVDVFSITGRGAVMTGQVKTGAIAVGDTVCIPLKSGDRLGRPVAGLEMSRKQLERVDAGQMVGMLVDVDHKLVSKDVLLHSDCELADDHAEQ